MRKARLRKPRKAIEVEVTANGFTWGEVIEALKERLARLEERQEDGAGFLACGYGASHSAHVSLRKVTREQFVDESIAWLDEQKWKEHVSHE